MTQRSAPMADFSIATTSKGRWWSFGGGPASESPTPPRTSKPLAGATDALAEYQAWMRSDAGNMNPFFVRSRERRAGIRRQEVGVIDVVTMPSGNTFSYEPERDSIDIGDVVSYIFSPGILGFAVGFAIPFVLPWKVAAVTAAAIGGAGYIAPADSWLRTFSIGAGIGGLVGTGVQAWRHWPTLEQAAGAVREVLTETPLWHLIPPPTGLGLVGSGSTGIVPMFGGL